MFGYYTVEFQNNSVWHWSQNRIVTIVFCVICHSFADKDNSIASHSKGRVMPHETVKIWHLYQIPTNMWPQLWCVISIYFPVTVLWSKGGSQTVPHPVLGFHHLALPPNPICCCHKPGKPQKKLQTPDKFSHRPHCYGERSMAFKLK